MCKKLPGPAEECLKGLRGEAPEGKISYSIQMKDGSPFVFEGFGIAGKIPIPRAVTNCVIITGKPKRVGQKFVIDATIALGVLLGVA